MDEFAKGQQNNVARLMKDEIGSVDDSQKKSRRLYRYPAGENFPGKNQQYPETETPADDSSGHHQSSLVWRSSLPRPRDGALRGYISFRDVLATSSISLDFEKPAARAGLGLRRASRWFGANFRARA